MSSQPDHSNPNPNPNQPVAVEIQPSSPRYPHHRSSSPGRAGSHRKVAIPVDLSDESAFAVKWAVQNYLRPGDTVTLVHVRPTSVLYGADWGSTHFSSATASDGDGGVSEEVSEESRKKKLDDDFESFTKGKIAELAQPLAEGKVPFRVHVVKDHDMKERLCLEIERLGMSVVIMGSRGFGASRSGSKSRLGSVSDYCVHHCVCPVVVVRFPGDKDGVDKEGSLHTVPEEDPEDKDKDGVDNEEPGVAHPHLHED